MPEPGSNAGLSSWLPWLLTTALGSLLVAHTLNSDTESTTATHNVVGSQEVLSQGLSRAERVRRIEEPLFEHFGINPDEELPKTAASPAATAATTGTIEPSDAKASVMEAKRTAEGDFQQGLQRCELEYMVMTVADPVDSNENYRFDLQLDALHKALSINPDDQWIFDGAYLPWQIFRDRISQNASLALQRREHWYQDEPGLLVYRRNVALSLTPDGKPTKDRLLLVFLVGELPTLGVQRDAFVLAVEEIDRLRQLSRKTDPPASAPDDSTLTIPVIGPVFSGAAHSLIEAIHLAKKNTTSGEKSRYEFCVITGSATAVEHSSFESRHIPFGATLCHADDEQQAVLHFLRGDCHAKSQRKIAWLVESSSTSGASFAKQTSRFKIQQNRMWQGVRGSPPVSEESADSNPETVFTQTVYPYPMQIARVRKGFELRLSNNQNANVGGIGLTLSASALPFDAPENTRDLPPPQTPQMTAPAVELVLGQIMDAIRRDNCEYVGIKATDIRDAIFLATMVKLHSPTAQLIILQTDLFHTHPGESDVLAGAIVVSSYPLFPEGLDWTAQSSKAKQMRVVLSNHSYYGIYNASLIQRALQRNQILSQSLKGHDHIGHLINQLHPEDLDHLIGYAQPFGDKGHSIRPGIWVQRIGAGGFYPVTWYPIDPRAEGDFSLLHSQHYAIKLPEHETPTTPVVWLDESVSIWLVFLVILWATIIIGAMIPRKSLDESFEWLAPLGSADACSLVRNIHRLAKMFLIGSALYITAVICIGHGHFSLDYRWRLIAFTHRNLFSGVSLLVPAMLTFLAWFVLSFGWLRRTYLADKYADKINQFAEQLRRQFPGTDQDRHPSMNLSLPLGNLELWRSRALILCLIQIIAVCVILFGHVWRTNSNVSGSQLLYWTVWLGLSGTLLAWWFALLELTSLFKQLKSELEIQREPLRKGDYGPCLDQTAKPDDGGLHKTAVDAVQADEPVPTPAANVFQTSKQLIDYLKQNTSPGIGRFMLDPGPTGHDKIARLDCSKLAAPLQNLITTYRMVQVYFVHLRNHLVVIAAGACCLVLAVNSTPFTSLPWLRLITTGGLLILALQACWFYLKLEQDEFLSFLLGTKPDSVEWNWAVIQRLGLLLLLAFATLLFQIYPETGGWLSAILEPIIRVGK